MQDTHVPDDLIHHPTIIKLQQQNFHRLISSAGSTTTTSSSSAAKQPPAQLQSYKDEDQSTYFSTATVTDDRAQPANNQRAVLHQRKQALMQAIQSINRQMEALDM